jgi:hypothetical protein
LLANKYAFCAQEVALLANKGAFCRQEGLFMAKCIVFVDKTVHFDI